LTIAGRGASGKHGLPTAKVVSDFGASEAGEAQLPVAPGTSIGSGAAAADDDAGLGINC
jgi:hypothetical protein